MGAEAMSSHGSRVGGGGGALSRQGSVCSLTFSEVEGQLHSDNLDDLLRSGRKTADEVWRDIQGAAAACPRAQMTLEDFLSRGGGPPADSAADTDTGSGACGWAQQLYQSAPAPAAQLELGRHRPAVVGRPVPRAQGRSWTRCTTTARRAAPGRSVPPARAAWRRGATSGARSG